jgi:hypothetical protein
VVEEGKAAPGEAAPGAPGEQAGLPPTNALAGNYGAASGPMSAAPNMIGDFFGGTGGQATIVQHFHFDGLSIQQQPGFFYTRNAAGTIIASHNGVAPAFPPGPYAFPIVSYNDASGTKFGPPALPQVPSGGSLVNGNTSYNVNPPTPPNYDYTITDVTSDFSVRYLVDIPNPSSGGVVGRTKIAENTSPIPRDRLLFNYSLFDDVPLAPGGVNVNRFTPGFEKTFFNGLMSFEMKIPMATTLDSTVVAGGVTDTSHPEFGNMALTWKTLLIQRETWAISGGLMVTVPTAADTQVVYSDGTPLLLIRNQATHLGPFAGFLWTPNDRFFAQGFFQTDVEANPNPVFVDQVEIRNQTVVSRGLSFVDDIHDTTFQYVDLGVGWWLYRGAERFRRLTGLACTAEVHWNHALKDTDVVSAGDWRIGDFSGNTDIWNLTLGAHLEWNDLTTVTLGYTTPLSGGPSREFDGEFRLMLNRRFGPQTRATRTPTTL